MNGAIYNLNINLICSSCHVIAIVFRVYSAFECYDFDFNGTTTLYCHSCCIRICYACIMCWNTAKARSKEWNNENHWIALFQLPMDSLNSMTPHSKCMIESRTTESTNSGLCFFAFIAVLSTAYSNDYHHQFVANNAQFTPLSIRTRTGCLHSHSLGK